MGQGPANDDFANAEVVTSSTGQAAADDTSLATKERGEPNHAGAAGGRSVWWYWTAPAAGIVTMDTYNSDFDTVLAVYTGSGVAGLTLIASNDDTSTSTRSAVTFVAHNGVQYRIAIDGYEAAYGSASLSWNLAPAGPLAAKLELYLAGKGTLTPQEMNDADVNKDGKLDVADLIFLLPQ